MKKLAVTGAIGSGKSFVCRQMEELGFPVFNCDDEARKLMREDENLRQRIAEIVGSNDKTALRDFISASRENAEEINRLVHPRVREQWENFCDEHKEEKAVVMECALLFETGFEAFVDKTICVTAPENERVKRVMARDGVGEDYVRKIMSLQLPQEEKMARADVIIKNY